MFFLLKKAFVEGIWLGIIIKLFLFLNLFYKFLFIGRYYWGMVLLGFFHFGYHFFWFSFFSTLIFGFIIWLGKQIIPIKFWTKGI